MAANAFGSSSRLEERGLLPHQREIAGGERSERRGLRRCPENPKYLRNAVSTCSGEVVERHLEDEAPQRRRVQMLGEVGGAGEGQRMALHPGQHLVHPADFPAALGELPVGKQRIRLVEDQEGTGVRGPRRRRRRSPSPSRPPTSTSGRRRASALSQAPCARRGSGRRRSCRCRAVPGGRGRSVDSCR